jgi:MOSC domain-containing protein YiiM
MPITIEGIFLTPVASGAMVAQPTAQLLKGIGMEGDRYAQRAGTYSVLTPEPGRQLTLISAEGVRQAIEEKEVQEWDENKSLGDLRRNVVLQGISARELLDSIGMVLELGTGGAKVFVHRNCVPCMYNERKNQIKGMMEALWDAGGVSCEIIESGRISIGDSVVINASKDQGIAVDDGGKPSWFYVRPSQRSAEMVKEALAGNKKAYQQLKESDPEGVRRAQASYESVGLSFWPKS